MVELLLSPFLEVAENDRCHQDQIGNVNPSRCASEPPEGCLACQLITILEVIPSILQLNRGLLGQPLSGMSSAISTWLTYHSNTGLHGILQMLTTTIFKQ